MKRLFTAVLALLLVVSCMGCSHDNTSTIDSTSSKKNDDVTVATETVEANLYDENTAMFICQDRADIEGDRYVVYQYNYKGDLIKSEEANGIGFYAKNGLAPAYDPATDLMGFVDYGGVFVIEPKWKEAAAFSDNGIALVITENEEYGPEKYGFINEKGEEIVPFTYDFATSFYPCGLAIVAVVEPEYEGYRFSQHEYFAGHHNFGVIDTNGTQIIKPSYRHIEHIEGKYIICHSDTNTDIYDINGNKVYSEQVNYSPKLYTYQNDDTLIRSTYDLVSSDIPTVIKTEVFSGKTFVEQNDTSGIQIECKRVANTSTGYGYGVTKNGDTVIPYEYDGIVEKDGFFVAIKYINGDIENQVFDIYNEHFEKTAEEIKYIYNPYRLEAIGRNMKLPSGYFEVYVNDEESNEECYGIVDSTGKVIVPPLFYNGIMMYNYESFGGYFPRTLWW